MKNILILIITFLAGITVQAQSVGGRYYAVDGSMCTITVTGTGIVLSVVGIGNSYYVACGQEGNTLSFCNYTSGQLNAYVLLDGRLGMWTVVGNSTIVFAKEGSGSCIERIYTCEEQINKLTQQLYNCTGY